MDSTVASPLLRKSDSSSVRSGFCKLYTFLNVLIFQDVVIFTFVEDMKFFPNCWFLWKITSLIFASNRSIGFKAFFHHASGIDCTDQDDNWTYSPELKCKSVVCAVQTLKPRTHEVETDVILDSGADWSCLPEYANHGANQDGLLHDLGLSDAQGNLRFQTSSSSTSPCSRNSLKQASLRLQF